MHLVTGPKYSEDLTARGGPERVCWLYDSLVSALKANHVHPDVEYYELTPVHAQHIHETRASMEQSARAEALGLAGQRVVDAKSELTVARDALERLKR